MEVVAEIEKQERIKIGERKKKELIKKLVGEQTNQIEERKEATIKQEVGRIDKGFQQLLSLYLVRGDRSGSGKRKRDARAGRWASWIVDQGMMGKRVWKRGLRRLGYDEPMSIVEDELPRLVLNITLVTEEFTQDLESVMSSLKIKEDESGTGQDIENRAGRRVVVWSIGRTRAWRP